MRNAGLDEAQAARKAMTNLDSILKSRDITLLTKVYIVRAMVFSVVVYRFESWTVTNGSSAAIRRGWSAGSLSF